MNPTVKKNYMYVSHFEDEFFICVLQVLHMNEKKLHVHKSF